MDEIDHLDFEADLQDITAAVVAAADRITEELLGRLEGHVSERDAVAWGEAVRKATMTGAREAHAAIRVRLLREKIEIGEFFSPDVDVWAERYGDEADEDE
jgi:hypothetical protein